MIQLAAAACGALVTVACGLWIVQQTGRWRRRAGGTGLILAGLVILLFCFDPGWSLPGRRQLLIVHSPSLSAEDRKAALNALEGGDPKLEVAWVKLEPAGAGAERPEPKPARFARVESERASAAAGPDSEPVETGNSLWELVGRLEGRFGEPPTGRFRERGFLFLGDQDPVWERLRLGPGFDEALGTLTRSGLTSSLSEKRAPVVSPLEVTLETEEIPSRKVTELPQMVFVTLNEADGPPAGTGRAEIERKIDRACTSRFSRPLSALRFPLSEGASVRETEDCRKPLQPGFHRLALRIKAPRGSWAGVRYFRISRPALVILHPPASPGEVPAGERLKEFLEKLRNSSRSFDVVQWPAENDLHTQALPPGDLPEDDRRWISEKLAASRALLLVEPTGRQLWELETRLQLSSKIEEGLSVMVARPPTRESVVQAGGDLARLSWLPAWAHDPAPPDSSEKGATVTRDFRLYLLLDASRFAQLPNPQAPSDRPLLTRQLQILQALYRAAGVEDEAARLRIANGRVMGPAEAVTWTTGGVDLEILPPLTVRAHLNDLAGRWEENWQQRGILGDLAPASPQARLRALYGGLAKLPETMKPLDPYVFYPNSGLVVFVPDLPEELLPRDPWSLGLRWRLDVGDQSEDSEGPGAGVDRSLADLAAQGIQVFRVALPVPGAYKTFYGTRASLPPASPAGVTPGPLPAAFKASPPGIARVGASAPELITALRGWLDSRGSGGRLERREGGRAVDPRIPNRSAAPALQTVLEAPSRPSPLEPAHAVFTDPGKPLRHLEMPGVTARSHGNGHVAVLAWSPFASDLWRTDSGDPEARDGWGVQRAGDLLELSAGYARVSSKHPVLREVRELPDGATVLLDVWFPEPPASLFQPTLNGKPLEWLPSEDPHRRSFQFQLSSDSKEEKLEGFYRLVLDESAQGHPVTCGKNDVPGPGEECVFLSLRKRELPARTVLEALRILSVHSGGLILPFPSGGDEPTWQLGARRSWSRQAGLLLGLIAVLLFSPLARPWTGLRLALSRQARRRKERQGGPPGEDGRFDVEGVLADWGQHPGEPSSIRQAGTPASHKFFEPGDDLAAAEPSSLVAFTSLGKRLGLPPRKPRLRRRHVARALEAILVIDTSPSLFVPDTSPYATKLTLARVAADLLSRVLWRQAGSVRALTTRNPQDGWGPRQSEDDAGDLQRFLADELAKPRPRPGLPVPADLLPGHTVFLLSDLLTPSDEELDLFVRGCLENDAQVRVLHLQDPQESRLVGFGWEATSGLLIDRMDWEPEQLEAAAEQRSRELRSRVEKLDARYVALSSHQTDAELLQSLLAVELPQ